MKTTRIRNLSLALLAVSVVAGCGKQSGDNPLVSGAAAPANATNQSATAVNANADFAKLKGRWQRADGDYIVEIRSVEPGGKMDAAYFNPQPIHVAKAQAAQNGEDMNAFIELRDVNYPGSTYRLSYDPGHDRLDGTYFQAVTGETYDVVFVRINR